MSGKLPNLASQRASVIGAGQSILTSKESAIAYLIREEPLRKLFSGEWRFFIIGNIELHETVGSRMKLKILKIFKNSSTQEMSKESVSEDDETFFDHLNHVRKTATMAAREGERCFFEKTTDGTRDQQLDLFLK